MNLDETVLRNFVLQLFSDHTNGFRFGVKIQDCKNSELRNKIAKYLIDNNCLRARSFIPVGRDGITGDFDYSAIERVVQKGEYQF